MFSLRNLVIVIMLIVSSTLLYAQKVEKDDTNIESKITEYEAGNTYYGRNKYIQYTPGTLPIVISAPHGGYEKVEEMADRTYAARRQDIKTRELTLVMQEAFKELTNGQPYVIISNLHRIKMDPNRPMEIASQGDSLSEISYNDFHGFIKMAEADVKEKWGRGMYFDVHAHHRKYPVIELGYLIEPELLELSDEDLSDALFIEKSSIRNLVKTSPFSFTELLRGSVSFGALLDKYGYQSIPSPALPNANGGELFAGGFNTFNYCGNNENPFIGIQLETPFRTMRDSEENIKKFGYDLVRVIAEYLKIHYEIDIISHTAE